MRKLIRINEVKSKSKITKTAELQPKNPVFSERGARV